MIETAGAIKSRVLRWGLSWISLLGLNAIVGILLRRDSRRSDMLREQAKSTTETEVRVTQPQTKDQLSRGAGRSRE